MAKASKSRKTSSRPRKKSRPLTATKKVQEANKQLMEHFSSGLRSAEGRVSMRSKQLEEAVDGIRGGMEQVWKNQQLLNSGLSAAEAHAMVQRRVLNDALGGVTRFKTVERRVEAGKEEMKKVQLIDWGWYSMQLDYCYDTDDFMAGTLTPDEVIERKAKERQEEKERREAELHQKKLEVLEKAIGDMLKKQAEELHPLLEEGKEEEFSEKVRSIYPALEGELFDTACGMIREKLQNAPTQEEMLKDAEKLKEKIRQVTEEASKRERGEPYDEALLAEADAMIAEGEKRNPFPEGAAIFGGGS